MDASTSCILCSCKIENVDQVVCALKGIWETVLVSLFPEVPRQILEDHLICDLCYDRLSRLKIFKNRCQTVENEIVMYGKTHNIVVVQLKDIRQDAGQDLDESARICRTCLRKVDGSQWDDFSEDSPHYSTFKEFHIDLNMTLVPNSIICHYCTENLDRLRKMQLKCLQQVAGCKTEIITHITQPTTSCVPPIEESYIKREIKEQHDEAEQFLRNQMIPMTDPFIPDDLMMQSGLYDIADGDGFVEKTEFFVDISDITRRNISKVSRMLTTGVGQLNEKLEENCELDENGTKVFRCVFCDYRTARKGNLKAHIECRHGKSPVYFECHLCGYTAPRKVQLGRHIRMRHDKGGEELGCEECDFKTTIVEYLRKHVANRHRDDCVTFGCPHCDFRSKWRSNLKKHVRNRHEKELKVHKCPYCEYATLKRRSYRRHLKAKHTKEEDMYRCELCDFKTSIREYLTRHFRVKHDDTLAVYTCEVCNKYKTKSKKELQRHKDVVHEKKEELEGNIYECSKCPFKTLRKKTLAYHTRMHDATKAFKCSECNYESKFKNNLKTHVRYKHRKETVMEQCSQCDYKAKWKESLKKHIASKHGDKQKLYECAQCKDYKVLHERTLIRHIKSKHNQFSQTFKCSICSFQTNLVEYLRKHVAYKHNNTTMFQCRHCQFKTKGKHSLKKHLRVRHGVEKMDDTKDMVKVRVEKKETAAVAIDVKDGSNGLNFKFIGLEQAEKEPPKAMEEVIIKVEQKMEYHCSGTTAPHPDLNVEDY